MEIIISERFYLNQEIRNPAEESRWEIVVQDSFLAHSSVLPFLHCT